MLVAAVEDMLDITVVGNTDTIIQSNRKSLNSTLQLKRFCGRKYCERSRLVQVWNHGAIDNDA